MSDLTWRYLSWRADVDSSSTSAASFRCSEAFCSPSAATTLARASLAASASAAMALCSCTGTRTSWADSCQQSVVSSQQSGYNMV